MKKYLIVVTPESTFGNELSLTILRVFAGLSLALAHGMGKFPISEGFVAGVEALGFPMPFVFAWAAALSEFAGGLLLALGLLTRPAAFLVAFTMFVAGVMAHAADPFQKKEMAFLYLAIALVFMFRGGGKWSVDRFMR